MQVSEIGRAAMRRANATALSFMSRMAQGAGITPWSAAPRWAKLMQRSGRIKKEDMEGPSHEELMQQVQQGSQGIAAQSGLPQGVQQMAEVRKFSLVGKVR